MSERRSLDLADALAAEARALFENLPDGEIDDLDTLVFRVDEGVLTVFVERTARFYTFSEGKTWAYVSDAEGVAHVDLFEHGRLVESLHVDLAAWENRPWPPSAN